MHQAQPVQEPLVGYPFPWWHLVLSCSILATKDICCLCSLQPPSDVGQHLWNVNGHPNRLVQHLWLILLQEIQDLVPISAHGGNPKLHPEATHSVVNVLFQVSNHALKLVFLPAKPLLTREHEQNYRKTKALPHVHSLNRNTMSKLQKGSWSLKAQVVKACPSNLKKFEEQEAKLKICPPKEI